MRQQAIIAIMQRAIAECYDTTGATQREIIRAFLTMFDLDYRLLEWHAGPDGAQHCLFCGNTHAERHADNCPWIA